MEYFTGDLNSAQFYERMATAFCDSVKFKIYLNIENNLFRVHKSGQDLKKIQISTLMGNSYITKWQRTTPRHLLAMRIIFSETPLRFFNP